MNFIKSCIEANKELYNYINYNLDKTDLEYCGTRGEGGDRSLNIDLIAESIFVKYLSRYGDIYSEESGIIKNNSASNIQQSTLIIIDPIDGSNNFLSNLPYYGSSVALEIDGKVQMSVVCNLVSCEIFIKEKDKLIIENLFKKDIITHHSPQLSNIAVFERSYKYPQICQKFYDKGIKYRSCGAVALSLANARNYKFVLFGGSQRIFDLAAAMHICSDLNIYQNDEFLLVSENKKIFEHIKEIIKD